MVDLIRNVNYRKTTEPRLLTGPLGHFSQIYRYSPEKTDYFISKKEIIDLLKNNNKCYFADEFDIIEYINTLFKNMRFPQDEGYLIPVNSSIKHIVSTKKFWPYAILCNVM